MTSAGVFSCTQLAQNLDPRLRRLTLTPKTRPLLISNMPTYSVRSCASSHPLDSRLKSSLASYNGLHADAVKQDFLSNLKPQIEFYTELSVRLAGDGYLLEMGDLFATLIDAGIDPRKVITSEQLSDIRRACKSSLYRENMDVFLAFARKLYIAGISPMNFLGEDVFYSISRLCREMVMRGELDKCVEILTTLSGIGFSLRKLMKIKEVIAGCAKHGNVDAALKYARFLPPVNLHYNCIMHQFGKLGAIEAAFTAFTSMTESGIKPDMYSYRSLLDACAFRGDVTRATSVYKDIVSSGNIPNLFVYNSFMNACVEDTDVVWKIHDEMLRLDVEPVLATYNIMLKSCSSTKSFDKATSLYMELVNKAATSNFKLDVFTYSTTIHILGEAKMLDMALKVKEDMISSGVAPNVITWTALIGACGNVGMVDQAFRVFDEMLVAGCDPNEHTYNMLINACCKARQHGKAVQLFNEWKVHGKIYAQTNYSQNEVVAENRLSQVETSDALPYKGIAASQTAVKNFSKKAAAPMPSLVTYNILMKSCADEPELVKKFMEDILAVGLKPDLTSWSTYVDAYGSIGDLQEAIKLFKIMKEEGIVPDLVVYTSMIKACVKGRDADMAFEFFRELKEAGLQPNKVTYYTLFKAQRMYQKLSEVQRALALYEEMRDAGFAPNDGLLRMLLEQWAEGVIGNSGDEAGKTAKHSLISRNAENSGFAEYSKLLLQKVAVDSQDPDTEPHLTIDLHGLSRGEARVAVLALLRVIKERHSQGYGVKDDLVLVTGVGRRSEVPGSAIVREAVLHVLEKELNLPVTFAPTEVPVIRNVPPRIFNRDDVEPNVPTNENVLVGKMSYPISDYNPFTLAKSLENFGSSNTRTYTEESITPAFVMRKPTNFGRLIVAKGALEEWLSRKSCILPVKSPDISDDVHAE